MKPIVNKCSIYDFVSTMSVVVIYLKRKLVKAFNFEGNILIQDNIEQYGYVGQKSIIESIKDISVESMARTFAHDVVKHKDKGEEVGFEHVALDKK